MKRLSLIITCFVLFGCADKKAQKKAALDSVINIHDKIMGKEAALTKDKDLLDTLIKKKKLSATDTAALLDGQLAVADSAMEVWMQKFDFEQKGKTEEQSITYYHAQKKVISAIDSQFTKAVDESNQYLSKIKTK